MTVKVELGFTADGQGAPFLTLDDPRLGKLDDPNVFIGGGEVFVDVTEFFENYSVVRGKSRELERYQAGQASVTFENSLRTFDPTFEASPFFGQIVPKRKVRLTNNDVIQFEGTIEDWNFDFQPGGKSTATAQAFDAFSFLAGVTFSQTFAEQETSERINAVLDEIGWSEARRDLAFTGAVLESQTVEAGTEVLPYLQTVARSEPGELFISKAGDVKLVGRNAAFTSDGLVFSDDGTEIPYKTILAIFGSELLYNKVTVLSNADIVTSENSTSIQIYGERDLEEETFLSDTFQLNQLADYLVNRYAEPEFRFEEITVDLKAITAQQKSDILDLELGQVVKVEFTPSGISPALERFGKIIGMTQNINNNVEEVIFKLETTEGGLFVLGDPVFGKLDAGNLLGW